MTENLVYWAQALDNTSPDHIVLRGKEVSPEDATNRQEAVALVSHVIKSGTRVFDHGGVRLTVNEHRFVVEVLSQEHDQAGRTAPIVCCGEYDSPVDEVLGASVVAGIDDFAKHIGRTIRLDHFDMTRQAFGDLKKKASTKAFARMVGAALLAVTLVIVVYLLISRGLLHLPRRP